MNPTAKLEFAGAKNVPALFGSQFPLSYSKRFGRGYGCDYGPYEMILLDDTFTIQNINTVLSEQRWRNLPDYRKAPMMTVVSGAAKRPGVKSSCMTRVPPCRSTTQAAEPAAAKPPEAGGTAGRGPERNPGSRRAPCRRFGEVRAESPARQNKRRAFPDSAEGSALDRAGSGTASRCAWMGVGRDNFR